MYKFIIYIFNIINIFISKITSFFKYENIPSKNDYVELKLKEWKNEMYSKPYLHNIPNKCIYDKKISLIDEYNKNIII